MSVNGYIGGVIEDVRKKLQVQERTAFFIVHWFC